MQSLRELFRIGKGPSSSHTIGPEHAAKLFLKENPTADSFKVVLYGSLAKTGEGHGTQKILQDVLGKVEIVADFETTDILHPNTMDFFAYLDGCQIASLRIYSVGGGAIEVEGREGIVSDTLYPLSTFAAIKAHLEKEGKRLPEYAYACEGEELKDYLAEVWAAMKNAVQEGLKAKGELPGGLGVERRAHVLYFKEIPNEGADTLEDRLVCAYAFAVSEQNASGGTIVTAPTCGACGVLPAVLCYLQEQKGYADERIIDALAAAGIIGNLIKTNASISGAECGCQAEIGSACSMAAAAIAELYGMTLEQQEYAAEVAMEHHLGLTCDPIAGLVQIPCIERNAVAAMRALNAAEIAKFLFGSRKISFDLVVETMYETGRDMHGRYRETSEGGLAKLYKR
ncbi:MAG: L-serine ammonia-lyase, iron-sulfur-dependent, subunit alpha [Clostridia bacterium]|nr:L-serine ammonia-lyase, iron-sulfur-dependent, subunit alpha [Clostridia bacterium]